LALQLAKQLVNLPVQLRAKSRELPSLQETLQVRESVSPRARLIATLNANPSHPATKA
jgi:hypothetical protein